MPNAIRVVLVSHGEQSKGMLNTVQMLLGPQENIAAYCLYPEQDPSVMTDLLRNEIEQYGAENILFMSELMYGSPFNCLVNLTRDYDLHHITGTNQLMLMTALLGRCQEEKTVEEICQEVLEAGTKGIADVRIMMADDDEEEEE